MIDVKRIKSLAYDERDLEIEKYLDNYLSLNPTSVDAWMRLGVFVFDPPVADYEKSFYCFRKALSINPSLIDAWLVLARMQDICYRQIEEDICNQILKLETKDTEYMSMIHFARAWVYEERERWDEFEKSLICSVDIFQGHVLNYVYLADLYKKYGRLDESKIYYEKAIRNVRMIYKIGDKEYDLTCYKEFINERIKGTHLSYVTYDLIKEGKESVIGRQEN